MGKTTPNLSSLVDAFVAKINREPRERESHDDVPEFLRETRADDPEHVWTSWHIVRADNSARIDDLQNRIGRVFPPSFRFFLANYSWPAFESSGLMFFANTGENIFWELGSRLFFDPHMSPHLLQAGFVQIGNPLFYHYDPVCFDCGSHGIEKRIVQLDHEAILQRAEMRMVKEVAPSFPDLIAGALR